MTNFSRNSSLLNKDFIENLKEWEVGRGPPYKTANCNLHKLNKLLLVFASCVAYRHVGGINFLK